MISRTLALLRSDTALVALANALGAGLGFVVLAMLTRGLGAEGFGRLAPALAIMDLGPLFIDTVLSAGAVTVAARSLSRDAAEGRDALATALWLRLGAALVFALVVAAVSQPLARLPGLGSGGAVMLALAGVAGGFLATQTALIGGLQVQGRFARVGLAGLSKNALRAGVIGGLALAGWLSAEVALRGALLAAALAAALTLWLARPGYACHGKPRRDLLAQMLAINLWMAVASLSIVSGRVDVLLLSALAPPEQAAYYSAAMQLCIAVGVVSQAIVTTTLPRIAAAARVAELRAFLRLWARRAPFALAPVAVMPFLSPALVPLLLGPEFAAGDLAFDILFASSMLALVVNPVLMVLFPLGAARIFGLAALAQVVGKTALAIAIIPWWGAAGVAAVDLATRLIAAAVILLALRPRLAGDAPLGPPLTETAT